MNFNVTVVLALTKKKPHTRDIKKYIFTALVTSINSLTYKLTAMTKLSVTIFISSSVLANSFHCF